MKNFNYSFIRIVFSLIMGLFLILYPDTASTYLIVAIGVIFLIPGVFGVMAYAFRKSKREGAKLRFPLEAVGSVLLGLALFIFPDKLTVFFLHLISVVVILLGLQQIYLLFKSRKFVVIPWGYYILPLLSVGAGFYVIINASKEMINNLFIVIGAIYLFYCFVEIINWVLFIRKANRREDIYIE